MNIAEFNEIKICTAYSGKSGQTNHEAMRKDGPAGSVKVNEAESTCWKVPSIGPERGKLRKETRWAL